MGGLTVCWEDFAYHRARRAGHDGRLRRLASLSPLIDAPVLTEIIGDHRRGPTGPRVIHRGDIVLRDILHDFDALLVPDPQPEQAGTVLEAMAVGLPILGTPADWLAELTFGCGALGPDVPALVRWLAADPALYQRWSAAALGRAQALRSSPVVPVPPEQVVDDRYPGQQRMLRAGGYLYAGW